MVDRNLFQHLQILVGVEACDCRVNPFWKVRVHVRFVEFPPGLCVSVSENIWANVLNNSSTLGKNVSFGQVAFSFNQHYKGAQITIDLQFLVNCEVVRALQYFRIGFGKVWAAQRKVKRERVFKRLRG